MVVAGKNKSTATSEQVKKLRIVAQGKTWPSRLNLFALWLDLIAFFSATIYSLHLITPKAISDNSYAFGISGNGYFESNTATIVKTSPGSFYRSIVSNKDFRIRFQYRDIILKFPKN